MQRKNIFKFFVITIVTVFLFTACGQSSSPNQPLAEEEKYLPLFEGLVLNVSGFEIDEYETWEDEVDIKYRTEIGDFFVEVTATPLVENSKNENLKPEIISVTHQLNPPYEELLGDSWEDGHAWIIPGASSTITAAIDYKKTHFDIYVTVEYIPRLNTPEEGEKKYLENKEQITEILGRLEL